MSEEIAYRCLELLKLGLDKIDNKYIRFNTASENNPIITRERVFCYELYYQMRSLQTNNPGKYVFDINAEPDKQGYTQIKKEHRKNPDFIFHNCGIEKNNYLIVEVKGRLHSNYPSKILLDFETLHIFIKKYHYKLGAFVLFGYDYSEFESKMKDLLKSRFSTVSKDSITNKIKIITKNNQTEVKNLADIIK